LVRAFTSRRKTYNFMLDGWMRRALLSEPNSQRPLWWTVKGGGATYMLEDQDKEFCAQIVQGPSRSRRRKDTSGRHSLLTIDLCEERTLVGNFSTGEAKGVDLMGVFKAGGSY
jgi:hypothetical protein